MLQKLLAVI